MTDFGPMGTEHVMLIESLYDEASAVLTLPIVKHCKGNTMYCTVVAQS